MLSHQQNFLSATSSSRSWGCCLFRPCSLHPRRLDPPHRGLSVDRQALDWLLATPVPEDAAYAPGGECATGEVAAR